MRPKYKIGTMVQFGNAEHGVIEAIVQRKDTVGYFVEGKGSDVAPIGDTTGNTSWLGKEISEDSITASFRAFVPRTASTSAKKNSSKSNKKANLKNVSGQAHAI